MRLKPTLAAVAVAVVLSTALAGVAAGENVTDGNETVDDLNETEAEEELNETEEETEDNETIEDPSNWSGLDVASVASAITGPPPWAGPPESAAVGDNETELNETELNESGVENVSEVDHPSGLGGAVVSAIASATQGPPPWAGPPDHAGVSDNETDTGQGPPEHAGPSEDRGPDGNQTDVGPQTGPDQNDTEVGPPEDAGPDGETGPPENAGPDGAGGPPEDAGPGNSGPR